MILQNKLIKNNNKNNQADVQQNNICRNQKNRKQ